MNKQASKQASGIAVAIQEAKKMRDLCYQKAMEAKSNKDDCEYNYKISDFSILDDLVEILEKQPEQSRYEIAMEVMKEYLKDVTENRPLYTDWLEEKNK